MLPPTDLTALAAQQPAAHAKVAVGPHAAENAQSQARVMAAAAPPRTLAGAVRWVRWASRLEVPFRLHEREPGDNGAPRMTGQFATFLASATLVGAACATDDDGWYLTPFRCALLTLHGRDEGSDGAGMAHLVAAIASAGDDLWSIAARLGITPTWVVAPAAEQALRRMWDLYAPARAARS